ncbi:hypothetical protein BU15DRAFT_71961 [Melanogaster broomeanus]|nr:hypothetical protein BU15DRAFT_71961 [Melanogaster broomeanus]
MAVAPPHDLNLVEPVPGRTDVAVRSLFCPFPEFLERNSAIAFILPWWHCHSFTPTNSRRKPIMRIKDLWVVLPVPAKLKLFWDRITLSRTASFYFAFSVLHCVVQIVFQVQAFKINVQAANFLASITEQGQTVDPDAFYVLGNDLRLCDRVPTSFSTSSCQVIWDGLVGNNTLVPTSHVDYVANTTASRPDTLKYVANSTSTNPPSPISTPAHNIQTVEVNGMVQVVVNGLGWNNETAVLNRQCLWALGWPVQMCVFSILDASLAERAFLLAFAIPNEKMLAFVAFQIWVMGMSIVALLNESVPHTIAALLTHLVATGWAGFQIFNTAQFRGDFARVTTNGACHPINLLPSYWQSRAAAEIPSLVLNAVALLVSAYLSWRLAKLFGWQTFKRVGASLTISRIYKFVLTLSIVIQLSLFFIVTSIALWLDQLWNGAIGHLADTAVYKPSLIITLILLFPWLTLGWFSVRRERRREMLVFLIMCLGYLGGWGAMFASTAFRWTYMTWTFFGLMTTASVFLTLVSFILGIICRINFGKGLPQCLNAQGPLPGDDFEPVTFGSDPEKVAFPSSDNPTFSVAFGSEQQIPPLSQTPAPSTWQRAVRSMRMSSQSSLQRPSPVKTRPPSAYTFSSLHRYPSHSSVNSSVSADSPSTEYKRWVIEE